MSLSEILNMDARNLVARYRPLDGTVERVMRIIDELGEKITLCRADSLNDIFDGFRLSRDFTGDVYNILTGELTDKKIHYYWYISCFTRDLESPMMWAMYANNHQGVCHIYSTDFLFVTEETSWLMDCSAERLSFDVPKKGRIMRDVEYIDHVPKIGDGDFEKALFTKSNHWRSEREYRAAVNFRIHGEPPKVQRGNAQGSLVATIFGACASEYEKEIILTHHSKIKAKAKMIQATMKDDRSGYRYEHLTIPTSSPN